MKKLFVQEDEYTCGFACLVSALMLAYKDIEENKVIQRVIYRELIGYHLGCEVKEKSRTKLSGQVGKKMITEYLHLKKVMQAFNENNPRHKLHLRRYPQTKARAVAQLFLIDAKTKNGRKSKSSRHWVLGVSSAKETAMYWDPYGSSRYGWITGQGRKDSTKKESWGCWRDIRNLEMFFLRPTVADGAYFYVEI